MGKIALRGEMKLENVFSHFIDSCNFYLDFLVQKYSFSKNQPKVTPPECSIDYQKGDVIFSVIYEYDDFPWIRVSNNSKESSLDTLLKKRWPKYVIDRKNASKDVNEKVDYVLKKYSDALQEHIEELLPKII